MPSSSSSLPQVVVTRPQPEAQVWVDALTARGFNALALPLIEILPSRHGAALASVAQGLARYQAVMFVSAPAVVHFFAAAGPLDAAHAWHAWATGPGTAKALQHAGVDAARIDLPAADADQWDSEALWAQVRHQVESTPRASPGRSGLTRDEPCYAPRHVLIVRGSDAQGHSVGRDWLAQQLQAAGVQVETAVAYERHVPQWTEGQRASAEQAVAPSQDGGDAPACSPAAAVWVFSSSEAITNLQKLVPVLRWARARAVTTHPRIAQVARDAGFGVVCESRPGLEAVLASIKSLI